jgi:hypothetical protein
MTGVDIILLLIALGVLFLIGAAAADGNYILSYFAIVWGYWYNLMCLIFAFSVVSIVYLIAYWIVTIGLVLYWRYGDEF